MRKLPYHARDEHTWEGGQCDFHPMTLCSCRQCDEGNLKCEGRAYRTQNVLSCPYHSLAYQVECEKRAKQAAEVIHPVLVDGLLTRTRPCTMFWYTSGLNIGTSNAFITRYPLKLGLLQSNMSFMTSYTHTHRPSTVTLCAPRVNYKAIHTSQVLRICYIC